MGKRTASTGHGSLASGAVTALALAVQSGLAAVVGVVIARELGRTAETDGFFAAYGVFVVLALAATAIRLVVLPPLGRARVERRLGQETAAWAVALAVVAVPLLVVAFAAAQPAAAVLTGFGPEAAREAAESVMPLMVLAAVAQLYAGLAASALAAWAVALAVVAVPLLVVAFAAAKPAAAVLTGFGPEAAREAAESVMPLMVLAAVAQLYAGLAASALAALDDYLTAAITYIVASIAGLAYILVRVDADGIDAVAVGMALNGLLAVALPTLALLLRARREAMPRGAVRPAGERVAHRLLEAGRSAALPLALQAVYLVCLPFAAREGVGSVTSFGYAYLAASALVAVTSSSLGLVTSVPLTRIGLDPGRVARHVVSSSWLALVAAGAAAGVFAVAGTSLVGAVLGDGYLADVGEELGHLIALLSPWMVFSIGFSVTLPLLFVQGRTRGLLLVGLALLALHVPLAWLSQELGGLTGLALALAVTTLVALAVMLHRLHAARPALSALSRAALSVAALAVVAFALPTLGLDAGPAAAVGLALYAVGLAVWRPRGLRQSWSYLRSLA